MPLLLDLLLVLQINCDVDIVEWHLVLLALGLGKRYLLRHLVVQCFFHVGIHDNRLDFLDCSHAHP
jgi:hypothetical protein